jgi:hypothetical protein
VRLRLAILAVCGISLCASAGADAYPWPVKPFYRQHPIRANFGDPRTVFLDGLFTNGAVGPGTFQFHNGIDISAPDGTEVYPVESGIVRLISGEAVAVTTPSGRTFQYFHIIPTVISGEHVYAQRSVLGYIRAGAGHVHLTEIRGYRVWNPLAKGGVAPYQDLTDPTVRAIYIRRWNTLASIDAEAVCGKVSIAADAYDTQSEPVHGAFAGFPVSPALVTWSVTRADSTRRLAAVAGEVDFRTTLPSKKDFWKVYARGTYQNGPRFGPRQYLMAGLFMFQLTRQGLETRDLPNGTYKVTVHAYDIKGNEGGLVRDFRIANDPASPTGCRPSPPASPPVQNPPATQPASP